MGQLCIKLTNVQISIEREREREREGEGEREIGTMKCNLYHINFTFFNFYKFRKKIAIIKIILNYFYIPQLFDGNRGPPC